MSDYARMTAGERQAAAAELARAAHGPPNGGVAPVEAQIREFERRYEMTSAQMEGQVNAGRMAETEEIAHWLITLEVRRLLGRSR
jgi:hypothetical protein